MFLAGWQGGRGRGRAALRAGERGIAQTCVGDAPPIVVERNCATLVPPCRAELAPLRFFLLSPPDPLRWAPAGAPLVLPKRTGRARSKRKNALSKLSPCKAWRKFGDADSERDVGWRLAGFCVGHEHRLSADRFLSAARIGAVQIWIKLAWVCATSPATATRAVSLRRRYGA